MLLIAPATILNVDPTCDEKSMISIRDILEATGAVREDAERAATVIQVSVSIKSTFEVKYVKMSDR